MRKRERIKDVDPLVFDIEKFAVHDGPGIRTVVFMKGCPLRCKWCHNPESQSCEAEIFFSPEKCIGCGWCFRNCPQHCHSMQDGKHVYDRTNCTHCGKCTEQCYAGALEVAGRKMSVAEVMKEVLSDKIFYENSHGGLTLSGGEPLMHLEFSKALLAEAKKNGLHTAVETCGFAPWHAYETLLPLVDLWLWDVKARPEDHRELTGVESTLILENLRKISGSGAKFVLRCPLVPGVNDSTDELIRIAELAESLKGCLQIDLEPYHPLGESKSARLGRTEWFSSGFPEKERVNEYVSVISSRTKVPVHKP